MRPSVLTVDRRHFQHPPALPFLDIAVNQAPNDTAAAAPTTRPALSILYGGTILVAALYFGRELVVPLVLASLLAFVLAPACVLLQRLRFPKVAAVIVVVLLAFGIIGSVGLVVGRQAAMLAGSLPSYESTVREKWQALGQGEGPIARLIRAAMTTPKGGNTTAVAPEQGPAVLGTGQSNLAIARTVAEPLLGPVGTGGVVLIFLIFILMARDDLRDRLVRLVGRNDLHRTIMAMNDAARRLSRYFLFQLALNSGFGALIGVSLWLTGLPNPLLWGILSGLMRFVPYIGVFIALAPPLLLAVAIVPGWSLAIVVLALFVGAELVMGQLVEPLIYGHSTGLSPLAVIVATAFWALLWGPIGLLIATPLTVCLVVVGRHVEALAFIDVILGDKPPLEPPETFYQRALEGHAVALVPAARRQIAASSLIDYYDTVALPGLALAQGDLMRDDLAFERLEGIHAQIEAMLARLSAGRPRPTDAATRGERLARVGFDALDVVCIPGRGQLDDLAAAMAVQALAEAGFRARLEANMVLGASNPVDLTATRLCCLSILEEGSGVSGIRYFVRRIRKRMPDAVVVVGLWHANRDSLVLSALRSEGTDEHLVLSIGELLAFARTLAARTPSLPQIEMRATAV